MFKNNQQGISLYLSLMVVTMLLSISLGISHVFLGQIKTIKVMGDSVLAFYAADAGIERVLTERSAPSYIPETILTNQARYEVFVYKGPATEGGPEGTCTATGLHYCITSVGIYKETRRAIEIEY